MSTPVLSCKPSPQASQLGAAAERLDKRCGRLVRGTRRYRDGVAAVSHAQTVGQPQLSPSVLSGVHSGAHNLGVLAPDIIVMVVAPSPMRRL